MQKILGYGLGILVLAMMFVFTADAAGPRPQRGDVMVEAPEDYVFNAEWVTGTSADGGTKGQSIAMTDFAFYAFENWWDHNLSDVTKIRASFMADEDAINSGGSPRFSLMLDSDGDGDNDVDDVNVFLDPAHCGVLKENGWTYSDFTGAETDCTIYDSTGASYTSDIDGTAWSKLVAAYPDAKVWFLFLIQDATVGTNYVDRIMLDSAFFTKAP